MLRCCSRLQRVPFNCSFSCLTPRSYSRLAAPPLNPKKCRILNYSHVGYTPQPPWPNTFHQYLRSQKRHGRFCLQTRCVLNLGFRLSDGLRGRTLLTFHRLMRFESTFLSFASLSKQSEGDSSMLLQLSFLYGSFMLPMPGTSTEKEPASSLAKKQCKAARCLKQPPQFHKPEPTTRQELLSTDPKCPKRVL